MSLTVDTRGEEVEEEEGGVDGVARKEEGEEGLPCLSGLGKGRGLLLRDVGLLGVCGLLRNTKELSSGMTSVEQGEYSEL